MDQDSRDNAAVKKKPAMVTQGSRGAGKGHDMGSALRSIYDQTVGEAVPDEMMDLLGKLD